MTLDPLILSRLQFFWVIGWHILLPAFTIGLASFIAVMEGAHMVTGREVLFRISAFSIKIFSVAFGMGVVSGIVMPFQFGTNWSRFSAVAGNILRRCSPMKASSRFSLKPRSSACCCSAATWFRAGRISSLR